MRRSRAFQVALLQLLRSDADLLRSVMELLDPAYFNDDRLIAVYEALTRAFGDTGELPSKDAFVMWAAEHGEADPSLDVAIDEVFDGDPQDPVYIKQSVWEFIRARAYDKAVIQSADMARTGHYEDIPGLFTRVLVHGAEKPANFFDEFGNLERSADVDPNDVIPTGIVGIDDALVPERGLCKGEIGVVAGLPGSGKTTTLCNLGFFALVGGASVAHYSLELSKRRTAMRYACRMTGMTKARLATKKVLARARLQVVATKLTGNLFIEECPAGQLSVPELGASVMRLMRDHPVDLVIVDYADLMRPTERYDQRRWELADVYRDLRGMATDLHVGCWTASQLRKVAGDPATMEDLDEAFKKAAIADIIVTINRNADDEEAVEARLFTAKLRDGRSGQTVRVRFDLARYLVDNLEVDNHGPGRRLGPA